MKCSWCGKTTEDMGLKKGKSGIWICRECYDQKKYKPYYRVDSFKFWERRD